MRRYYHLKDMPIPHARVVALLEVVQTQPRGVFGVPVVIDNGATVVWLPRADNSVLQIGDVLTQVGSEAVAPAVIGAMFAKLLTTETEGEQLELTVMRGGETVKVSVVTAALGKTLPYRELTDRIRSNTVLIDRTQREVSSLLHRKYICPRPEDAQRAEWPLCTDALSSAMCVCPNFCGDAPGCSGVRAALDGLLDPLDGLKSTTT